MCTNYWLTACSSLPRDMGRKATKTNNSDLALVSTQVKILLYIVGLEAGESFDTSMSTCYGVGHITLEKQQDVIHTFTHRRCSGYII